MMKTICISVSDGSVARNILATDFLSALLREKDVRVVLVTPPSKREFYESQFGGQQVSVVELAPAVETFAERLLRFAAQNAFRSETLVLMQHRAHLSGASRIPPFLKRAFALICGWRWFRALVRIADARLHSRPSVKNIFDEYVPEIVLSTMVLEGALDVPLLREARRRGVKTVGMVRSWDNLTTYGFMRVIPQLFFAQNAFIRDMVTRHHDVPMSSVQIVGLPHYDRYVRKEGVVSREEFAASLNLDPHKKIFLYAAAGDFLFPAEASLVPILSELARSHDAQVIFRAHPAHASAAEHYKDMPGVFFDRSVTYLGEGYNNWDMTHAQEIHLLNTLAHCDILITASGTSMLVDGAVMDKPLVSVCFDGGERPSYWFSVVRFFDHAVHSKALLQCGGTQVVHNPQELSEAVTIYEQNPVLHEQGRKNILKLLAEPLGGAGERLASNVLSFLAR